MKLEDFHQLPKNCTYEDYEWSHEVSRESCPELYTFLEVACKKLGTTMPKFVLYDSNANDGSGSATYNRKTKTLYFDLALVRELENKQNLFKAVVSHELGHKQQSRRAFLSLIATSIAGMTALTPFMYDAARIKNNFSATANLAVTPLIAISTLACMRAIKRSGEYKADLQAATVVTPEDVIKSLETMPDEDDELGPLYGLFDTHPRKSKRINYIKSQFPER